MKTMTKEQLFEVIDEFNRSTMYSLLERATKKMRGISLNYDGEYMKIEFFFDSELTEEEDEEMDCAHAEVVSDIFPQVWDGGIMLQLSVVPSEQSITEKRGNLGWFYLRKEY